MDTKPYNHRTPMPLLQGLHCMLHIFVQSLWCRDHSGACWVFSLQFVLRMKLHVRVDVE